MKKVEKIAENKNYMAVNVGDWTDLRAYSFIHPKSGKTVIGKVFLKEPTNATGTEISLSLLPAHQDVGYLHFHDKDEETYIILQGSGFFQVDGERFPIRQGSVIRVAPEGVRGLCNTSDEVMLYVCIQSAENSLEKYSADDGTRIESI